jgi:hypothetical protein
MEINQRIQDWLSTHARRLGVIKSTKELIKPARTRLGLSECHEVDFIQQLELPDLPSHMSNLYEGDPCCLLRNISTACGLVKGRSRWAVDVNEQMSW